MTTNWDGIVYDEKLGCPGDDRNTKDDKFYRHIENSLV